jgi:enamine deaminase RidA (YjgF/YER057c/UK114 family)
LRRCGRRGKELGVVFREVIGVYNAAMSAVQVSALMDDRAKVEIEVTAVVPIGNPSMGS